ncbi:Zinc finger and BTB domain-containing protein 11 [Fukomys damarensis]|uniref:Large ribosomal subunit protein eL24 n=2 Tax=Rodentia TaxID=9989 RepID=A0A091ELX9_FUKDA|nr:Zinc finger and BTB domain-containing protein 11 [Fukomys damarensis]
MILSFSSPSFLLTARCRHEVRGCRESQSVSIIPRGVSAVSWNGFYLLPSWVFTFHYRVELCSFSGYKIYPGHGRRYARTDGKVFQFLNAKCESAFLSKRNPRQINWTVLYRRKHKKGQSEEIQKKRTRRAVKFQRAITGASLADIMAKRNQKPEVRKAQREQAIRAAKEAKKAKQASKKTAMAAAKLVRCLPPSPLTGALREPLSAMSSEESYRAILRYLTNEREPYAPGTEGNVKRKIRKAAACYVVRGGTLYYQRRQRHRKTFAELEVVLQPERRQGLIEAAHLGPGGTHHTRHQTWHDLSKTYWWRGILKQVKDYIKQCSKCQEKLDRSRPISDTSEMLEELGLDLESGEESNESEDDLSNFTSPPATASKSSKKKPVSKHELVFVDTKGVVKRSSPKHCQAVLKQLNEQRLSNQFCDVTLLIEGEEYKAHKSVLSANSEYFRDLFIEKGAISSHEAVVDLSGFCKASFLPLLEFAYTSVLSFDFCSMADVAILARHLFMSEVLEICESVHKLMEEKQLTVYKKGEVQTVASTQDLPEHHGSTAPSAASNEGSTTLSNELGDCEIVLLVNGDLPETEQNRELGQQPEPRVSSEPEAPLSSVGCVNNSHPEMESLDSITKNNQPEQETSDIREDDTVSNIHPKLSKETVIISSQENSDMENDTSAEDISKDRENLDQPLKDQENLVAPTAKTDPNPDDTYRSRLRQRSVNEGGYIRLHKGMEKKLQKRKALSKSAVQQVAQKLVQRGKKLKQPKRDAKENNEEASHKCGECGMVFQRRYAFIMHTLKHERARDYKCPSLHQSQKQFQCELCVKSFVTKRSLQEHMSIHTGVKPFECLTCGVAWADARSLKRHVRTHTGERPYVCPVCSQAYIDARTLRKHMTKFHTDYVPCKIMLEKDTLQFHNQGTQVEHAVSILTADMQEQENSGPQELETVVVTGETMEVLEAVAATEECPSVSTLSDQSIMQVVNYVLAQQQGQKLSEVAEAIQTVEVEVAHISEAE